MRVEAWVSSRTRRRRIWDARNLFRAPAGHCVIGYADPEQSPVCRQVRQQPGSGEGLDRQRCGRCPGADPAAVMATGRRAAWRLARPEATRRVSRPRRLAVACRVRTRCRAPRDGSHGRARRGCGKLQINRLFCKPICKPDAARQDETGETEPTERDGTGPVRRGHHDPRETARDGRDARRMAHNPEVEGSNPSPATKARGPFSNRERAFCITFVHDRAPSDDLPGQMTCRVSGQRLTFRRIWSYF